MPFSTPLKFYSLLAVAFLLIVPEAYASRLDYLRVQDVDHPHCHGRADLDVARDYFVEIANDVQGVQDYNELVRHYRRKRWDPFAQKLSHFREDFPNSPLQQPADFLELQAMLEQAQEDVGPPNIKLIEHRFQTVLLKNKDSDLLPVIYATTANFYLQRNMLEKSLALYEKAREAFPFHTSACVVMQGVAENRYLLNEPVRAKPTFELVLQKCKNPSLRLGAMVRLADMEWNVNNAKAEKGYAEALKKDLNRFNRFYPHALYNLAELIYRRGELKRSKFYFDEYLKHTPRQASCTPFALKRMADIAFKTNADIKKTVGLYMVAHEQGPATDVGRFSYVQGLLLELTKVGGPEVKRRVKVVDEELEKIETAQFRKQGYIDKTLSLIDTGEIAAVDSLRKLEQQGVFKFRQPAVQKFVRDKLLWYLEQDLKAVRASKETFLKDEDPSAIVPQVEQVYSEWMSKSPQAKKARGLYTTIMLERFQKNLPADSKKALKRLQQASLSMMWDPASSTGRNAVATALMENLWKAEDGDSLALEYTRNHKLLDPLVEGPYKILWVAVSQTLQDKSETKKLTAKVPVMRNPASMEKALPGSIRDFSYLVAGRAYRLTGKNAQAEASFLKVKSGRFLPAALNELSKLYLESKRYSEAYQVGVKQYKQAGNEGKLPKLQTLLEFAEKGNLTRNVASLVKMTDENNFEGKDRAPFYHYAGKIYYDRGQFGKASEMFEKVLASDKDFAHKAEAQYKLGKCLLNLRKPAQAKQILEELAGDQDKFWAPLARNELSILAQ
ncbi:MAG: tetratricopeptide repeat protein [Bdellovibrionaceae bacterium]|nr:tetratricopeptide repeat protein [Pseudobdellovibrionaceae bacterium]